MMFPPRFRKAICLALVAGILPWACASDNDNSTEGGISLTTVQPQADGSNNFEPKSYAGLSLRPSGKATSCVQLDAGQSGASGALQLAACSKAPSQRWFLDRGLLSPDGKSCLTNTPPNNFSLVPCNSLSPQQVWTLLPLLPIIYNAATPPALLASADSSGDPGVLVQWTSDTNTDSGRLTWQVSGPTGGATIHYRGDPGQCLATVDSSARLATCDKTDAAQLWSFAGGLVRNDNNQCLHCDPNTLQVSVGDCSFALENLFFMGQAAGLTCLQQSADKNSLTLVPTTGNLLGLGETVGLGADYWTYGGPRFSSP